MDIPNGAILWNNDEVAKESNNYGFPYQVEEPTNRIFDMEIFFHTKESATNKALGTMVVWRGGAC